MKPTFTFATLFISFALFAQQAGRLAERLKRLDRNGDGKVSAEEEALKKGMEDKSKGFVDKGAGVYSQVGK